MIAHKAGANTGLSVTMTAVSSLVAVFTTPLLFGYMTGLTVRTSNILLRSLT
jgi:predicted Na+-dependent transporter